MSHDEASAIEGLRAAGAVVTVDLGELSISLPAPGHTQLKQTTTLSPFVLALGVLAGIFVWSPKELIALWLFLSVPAILVLWFGHARLRAALLARRRVAVVVNDRVVRVQGQEMPLEELYAVITGTERLLLERKGAGKAALEVPVDVIAQPAMQALLYAMAHRRQATARLEGHDATAEAARPPPALDALRTRR